MLPQPERVQRVTLVLAWHIGSPPQIYQIWPAIADYFTSCTPADEGVILFIYIYNVVLNIPVLHLIIITIITVLCLTYLINLLW